MEKYNYLEAVTEDAKNAILENLAYWDYQDREELETIANDELYVDDSVTGNASGSYWCSTWQAEEALCHNWDIMQEVRQDYCMSAAECMYGPEWWDVVIRCWYLGQAISAALDELEAEGKIKYNNEEA